MKKALQVFLWVFMIALLALAITATLNRQWLQDYFRGRSYEPTGEMLRIRQDLALTVNGEFLFNASQPELDDRDEFNAHCRNGADSEIAVLGCYANNNIYVYNIEAEELDGIRELTAAHELLHAVFARMSETEKDDLKSLLEQVYKDNKDILERDLQTYDASEQFEELYVRAGTEVADLPEMLELHYAGVFSDQDKIVAFYNKYIAVFRRLEAKMADLKAEMEELEATIEIKNKEYDQKFDQIEAEVEEFNRCAETEGCFEDEMVFETRRNVLLREQDALKGLRDEINTMIDQYNAKVNEFNENVLYNEKLNQIVNSAKTPEKIQ